MSSTNTGSHVIKVLEALETFGQITAQEFADYADIGRYDAHAVLNPMTKHCLLYTSPSPRDRTRSRMPSSA